MQYRLDSFLRAQKSYKANTPIQTYMREHLLKMLIGMYPNELNFPYIFEFGCGHCELTNMIAKHVNYKHYICNDIHKYDNTKLPKYTHRICFDMRDIIHKPIYHKRFNLIASNACLQWLPFYETIQNLNHILHKNGILLIGTFGTDNYKEIRDITGIGLPYPTSEYIKDSMRLNFDLIAWHEEHIILNFDNPLEVFRHIKQSGVNALQSCYIKKSWLQIYANNYNNALTYHIVCFLARKNNAYCIYPN